MSVLVTCLSCVALRSRLRSFRGADEHAEIDQSLVFRMLVCTSCVYSVHALHVGPYFLQCKFVSWCADEQWQLLQPLLLDSALAWLEPHGKHGWAPPNAIHDNPEPICAALNLVSFLFWCEQAQHSTHTKVSHMHAALY